MTEKVIAVRYGSFQNLKSICFPAILGLCVGILFTSFAVFPFLSSTTGLEGFPIHSVVAGRLGLVPLSDSGNPSLTATQKKAEIHANASMLTITKETPTRDDATAKRDRIFCWILTQPKNYQQAVAIKETWAKRCDGYLFISSEDNATLPSIDAGLGEESRKILWGKTKFAFTHIYDTVLEDYDWYLKADDDTYVVMENLRYLVQNYSAEDLHYFGHHFKANVKQGYMSGGAGYVLSREAVRKLVRFAFLGRAKCERKNNGRPEDVELGICLQSVGVKPTDSRDAAGQGRFFPLDAETHAGYGHQVPDWYDPHSMYPEKPLLDCCSSTAISFHYVHDMYVYEYLIYKLRPHGLRQSE